MNRSCVRYKPLPVLARQLDRGKLHKLHKLFMEYKINKIRARRFRSIISSQILYNINFPSTTGHNILSRTRVYK